MYPLLASCMFPGFPTMILCMATPFRAISKRDDSGQDDEDLKINPSQVVYSDVPSVEGVN